MLMCGRRDRVPVSESCRPEIDASRSVWPPGRNSRADAGRRRRTIRQQQSTRSTNRTDLGESEADRTQELARPTRYASRAAGPEFVSYTDAILVHLSRRYRITVSCWRRVDSKPGRGQHP